MIESTVAHFIELGHYDSHLNRLSKTYRERWSTMAEATDKYFPYAHRRKSFGGTSFWITAPEGLDAEQLAVTALKKGIIIEPGTVHFGEPNPPRNYFRIGFSAITVDQITPGIKLLAKIIDESISSA
jgi:GntR family transcriptional regulator/MocR family aminotransferase